MKICHVITRLIVGGAQENTYLSAKGAVEAGHECVMLTGPTFGREGYLLDQKKNPGFELAECPFLFREVNPYYDWKAYSWLKDFFRKRKFDVIHTHTSKAGVVGRVAGYAAGDALVTHTIHGLAFGPFDPAVKNFIYIQSERYAARRCDRIYTVAQAMIDQCLANGIGTPDQFKVVYSGMELDRFLNAKPDAALRKKLGIPEGRKVVGAIARLFPRKGYEDFFPVAAEVVKKLPGTHFLVMGDGPARDHYIHLTESLGIRDHVTFAGLVPPDQIPAHIALTDAAAHFSLKEGLPRVAVQALAEEKPVIAYPLDGTPEVVLNGESGFLTPVGDHRAAAEAIVRVLSNDSLRAALGRKGREIVRDKFHWRAMSEILLADYEESLARKKIR